MVTVYQQWKSPFNVFVIKGIIIIVAGILIILLGYFLLEIWMMFHVTALPFIVIVTIWVILSIFQISYMISFFISLILKFKDKETNQLKESENKMSIVFFYFILYITLISPFFILYLAKTFSNINIILILLGIYTIIIGVLFIIKGNKDKDKLSKIFKYKWYEPHKKKYLDIFIMVSELRRTLDYYRIQYKTKWSKTILGHTKIQYKIANYPYYIIIEPLYFTKIIGGERYRGVTVYIGPKATIKDQWIQPVINLIEKAYRPIFS